MIPYLKSSFRERWHLFLIVILILSGLGLGYIGTQTVTDRISIQAINDLEKNWRYQYDILVLPSTNEEIGGLEDGWVAPQASIANYGGISLEDLEVIRLIPGVEVAAPVAMIGYINHYGVMAYASNATTGKWYKISDRLSMFDGYKTYNSPEYSYVSEYYDPSLEDSFLYQQMLQERGYPTNVPPGSSIRNPNEMLLVAIDPEAEEQLFNLSKSITSGSYLENTSVYNEMGINVIPVIALQDPSYVMEETISIDEVDIPDVVTETDLEDGIQTYLLSLPSTEIAQLSLPTLSGDWRFKNVEVTFDNKEIKEKARGVTLGSSDFNFYSPLQYKLLKSANGEIPTLEAIPFKDLNIYWNIEDIPYYREPLKETETYPVSVDIVGYYDSTKIAPQFAEGWKEDDPVDIYTPHRSMIIQNGKGEEVEPTPLLPLPVKASYYTGAPDMLTTLDALRYFYKDEPPLSSIRVVVEGVAERTEESQEKIELVANQIREQTGQRVEIMIGSGASKVNVKLAGDSEDEVGMVEEAWQQKGVSWSIEEQIDQTNVLLFVYLLLISLIFCYTVTTHSLLLRSSEFAMLRAIGWSRRKISKVLGLEILSLSVIPLLCVIAANIWIKALTFMDILLVWLILLCVICIGYITGSRKALKLSVRAGLEGEGADWGFLRLFKISSVVSYVFHQLLRRPLRFGLLAAVLALTTFMSILFVATQQSLSDFLFLSFLGETIDLNLKNYQTIFLIGGIVITLSIVILLQFLNITERKKEFFILRSIGWSMNRILGYLSIESLLVAGIGSGLGTMSAYALLTVHSSLWVPIWIVGTILAAPVILLVFCSWVIGKGMKMNGVVKDQHAA